MNFLSAVGASHSQRSAPSPGRAEREAAEAVHKVRYSQDERRSSPVLTQIKQADTQSHREYTLAVRNAVFSRKLTNGRAGEQRVGGSAGDAHSGTLLWDPHIHRRLEHGLDRTETLTPHRTSVSSNYCANDTPALILTFCSFVSEGAPTSHLCSPHLIQVMAPELWPSGRDTGGALPLPTGLELPTESSQCSSS
uniref:Uncharacterized protein n=1 Tax=Knipowitschia caucasica TaxID=637954 RepID=A0AAV2JQS7_KNICA